VAVRGSAIVQQPNQQDAWDQIRHSVFRIAGEIRFGKVEITIHEGDVVQVEVTEKFRQPHKSNADRTTGSTSYSSNRSTSE
jgi:hypothetical protein